MMRELVKKWLLDRGMVLSRPPGQFSLVNVKLRQAQARGLKLNCVLDGGASNGGWTRELRTVYPQATMICVEPRQDVQPALQQMATELRDIHIAPVLLGPEDRMTEFNESGVHSSALPNSQGKQFGTARQVEMITLDALIARLKAPWPDLIKLDLQGYELDALKGAGQCLSHAQALLLELSFFELQKGAPLADEVIAFLRQRGFCIYDIPSLWHRPLDGALAQGDFLFLRLDHPLRSDHRWSTDAEFA
jgi:FkbM family methyltransferase